MSTPTRGVTSGVNTEPTPQLLYVIQIEKHTREIESSIHPPAFIVTNSLFMKKPYLKNVFNKVTKNANLIISMATHDTQ